MKKKLILACTIVTLSMNLLMTSGRLVETDGSENIQTEKNKESNDMEILMLFGGLYSNCYQHIIWENGMFF